MKAMGLLRVKGRHFDVGAESTLEELLRMDGLFALKDIKSRLPISEKRLEKMYYDKGKFSACFCVMYKDKRNRGVMHVDLRRLNDLLSAQAHDPLDWRADGCRTHTLQGADMRPSRLLQKSSAVALLVLAGTAALAQSSGNPFAGVTGAFDTIRTIGIGAGAILGGAVTLYAGSRVASKLAAGEPFVKDLIFAIAGVLIASLSVANW